MEQHKIIFGTDGWRGLIDNEININSISRVAQAFAIYLKNNKKHSEPVAIAYDGRQFSREFAHQFAGVLCGNRIKVFLSDKVIPTPVLSYFTANNNCSSGVMITASHNPASYNGIKFKSALGGPFSTEETREVENLIDQIEVSTGSDLIHIVDFLPEYKTAITGMIDFESIKKSGIFPLIDSMGGAGGKIIESILQKHNIPSETIYGEATTDFSGRSAEPIFKNLQPLAQKIQTGNYSLGLATDGDADRLGVIRNTGTWMNIQETILYLSEYLLESNKFQGDLVKTLSVTDKLYELSKKNNCNVSDVQVGFKYVSEEMVRINAAFGAEESGGFGFQGHVPERDGILSALVFMEMMAKQGFNKLDKFISYKREQLGHIYYDRIDQPCQRPDRAELLQKIADSNINNVEGFTIQEILHHNSSRGLVNSLKFRLNGNPRWLLIRSSETEPMMRIYAEGESKKEVEMLLKAGVELIDKA